MLSYLFLLFFGTLHSDACIFPFLLHFLLLFFSQLFVTQEKPLHMDITRWSTRNQIDYILCSQSWKNFIQSAKTRLGADCGSDRELLIDKFRLKLKNVGKTIRPFRYDLNQIPYTCTVEVRNRFKELDLIECLKNYRQRFVTL